MKLYSYWRSSTSYRVRAALNLKRLSYEIVPVDLVAGVQRKEDYLTLNPGAGVPTLVLEDGTTLTQSLAILDYLDATWPEPQLIPFDPLQRARVLAAAHTVALDIHPVNNLRVLGELKTRFGATQDQLTDWMCHWMRLGFEALEAQLEENTPFVFGAVPDIADLCIIAQLYNARRWGLDLTHYPKLRGVEEACLALPEIAAAHPDQQPDAKVIS
ncbi:maleylacetoacetate isomerase/maleylpyruvate isomerase [Litoreibacter meonggei]|uniref:Maleylacetoacetate isomerase/maleylpyruvate isomerase n=1 Tax=Litoreibacter meonggei TaxID=1049199 RepID=A0A497WLD4_9RHOB|nr:maleylacetoacetate isomerase [Litoreibacter meonggei]RLJ51986.1 maleylacetoacetate isomerase/maleylpyruvate isomerase [Litoreibacter meonggei]